MSEIPVQNSKLSLVMFHIVDICSSSSPDRQSVHCLNSGSNFQFHENNIILVYLLQIIFNTNVSTLPPHMTGFVPNNPPVPPPAQ